MLLLFFHHSHMGLLPSIFLYICIAFYSLTSVKTESWIGVSKNELPEDSKLLQHLENVRYKRDAPSDGCTGNCGCQGPTKGSQVKRAHPQHKVVAYHYHHHYYYCCPTAAPDHAHRNPHAAHAAHRTQARPTSSVDCACNITGSCSCTVQEQRSGDNCGKQEPNQNAAFGFGMVLDNPIGKDFFEFISKNFVKKETPGQQACHGTFASNNFEDPVCRQFFDFFSQNFVRKPEQQTAPPTPPPTPAPTQAQQSQGNHFHHTVHEFNNMKTMFDTLNNEWKNTADLAKKMGLPME